MSDNGQEKAIALGVQLVALTVERLGLATLLVRDEFWLERVESAVRSVMHDHNLGVVFDPEIVKLMDLADYLAQHPGAEVVT